MVLNTIRCNNLHLVKFILLCTLGDVNTWQINGSHIFFSPKDLYHLWRAFKSFFLLHLFLSDRVVFQPTFAWTPRTRPECFWTPTTPTSSWQTMEQRASSVWRSSSGPRWRRRSPSRRCRATQVSSADGSHGGSREPDTGEEYRKKESDAGIVEVSSKSSLRIRFASLKSQIWFKSSVFFLVSMHTEESFQGKACFKMEQFTMQYTTIRLCRRGQFVQCVGGKMSTSKVLLGDLIMHIECNQAGVVFMWWN